MHRGRLRHSAIENCAMSVPYLALAGDVASASSRAGFVGGRHGARRSLEPRNPEAGEEGIKKRV